MIFILDSGKMGEAYDACKESFKCADKGKDDEHGREWACNYGRNLQ